MIKKTAKIKKAKENILKIIDEQINALRSKLNRNRYDINRLADENSTYKKQLNMLHETKFFLINKEGWYVWANKRV